MPATIEQILNEAIGRALRKKHPKWLQCISVEQTRILEGEPSLRPDILLSPTRLSPLVVETEVMPARTVEADARARLGKRLQRNNRGIESAVALRIPSVLREINQSEIDNVIANSNFTYCVWMLAEEGKQLRWPENGWLQGGIDELADSLESVTLSDSLINQSTDILETAVTQGANILTDSSEAPQQDIAKYLSQSPSEQTNRMAVAIIANAMMFHSRIEGQQEIQLLSALANQGAITKESVISCWNWIVSNVNYWPIFKIASDLLNVIPIASANEILGLLYDMTNKLALFGATGLNDLSGRMFQRLIADRKFLATFYTLPNAAALLAEIAVDRLGKSDLESSTVKNLKIADFACGTGTLIGAVYQTILARHRRTGNDDSEVHTSMIENALYAFDIMPAATHLTASTLSNAHPSKRFGKTNIVTMPYGYDEHNIPQIGSLDLIEDEYAETLLPFGRQQIIGSHQHRVPIDNSGMKIGVPHNLMDIVIMNPPFTRPTGQESEKIGIPVPSFAGFNTQFDEQRAMGNQLNRINNRLRKRRPLQVIAGNGNAGLASNFIDLAHEKIAPNGVLALILPFTFTCGDSWSKARKLLQLNYYKITVVAIATTGSTNRAFSADTGMAEVLVVAKRKEKLDLEYTQFVQFFNLYRRPKSLLEATTIAKLINNQPENTDGGVLQLSDDSEDIGIGSYIHAPFEMSGCAGVISVSTLCKAMISYFCFRPLQLPRTSRVFNLPVVQLDEIGYRGAHLLDISGNPPSIGQPPRGPFSKVRLRPGQVEPEYPALWNHDAERERSLVVDLDHQLIVKDQCSDRAYNLWKKISSRLHINVDFRINSQSLSACLTSGKSIGGRAWPNYCLDNPDWEIPVVLWMNTTLGLITFWWLGTRQQQGRSILPVSQHPKLLVLDPRSLTDGQHEQAVEIFEEFFQKSFLPANEAYRDEIRIALDRAVLVDLLNCTEDILEPLAVLRDQWSAEPSVHGGKSTRPGA